MRKFTLLLSMLILGVGSVWSQTRTAVPAPYGPTPQVRTLPQHNSSRAAGDTLFYVGFDGNDFSDTVAAPGFGTGFFDEDSVAHSITLQNAGFGVASTWLLFNEVLSPGDTNLFVGIASWLINSTAQSDDWVTLGPIVVPANGAKFSWRHWISDNDFRDGYRVLVGNQGGLPADFNSATVLLSYTDNDTRTDGDTLWTPQMLDLDGATYGGDTVWLAIHHNATDQFLLYMDDFTVVESQGSGVATNCNTDLFFSEYIEGSSSNKAIEIYNPNSNDADLSNYKVLRYNNGSATPSDSLFLRGMLASGDVYVVGNASAVAGILAVSDTTHSITFYNGDDAMVLINIATGDTLDIIGKVGEDPGTNWPVAPGGATSEFTLVRKASINEGTTDWALSSSSQWEVFAQNMADSLGDHSMMPCSSGGTGCTTDLFFSEYLEGSSNNKAIEIYNPNSNDADLSNYKVLRYNNGSVTPSDSLFMSGMLASGGVYVIANPSAVAGILAVADTTHTITFYNGDDAMVLINTATGDTLDIIGKVGEDPGTNWPVAPGGATSEFTLVRKASINEGTTDWALSSSSQWMVFAQNMADSLGAHYMTPCGAGGGTGCNTEIFFSEYIEGSSFNKGLEIYNPNDTTVDLSNYQIQLFSNGAVTKTDSFALYGTLASGAVFVVVESRADSLMKVVADTALSFPSVIGFNGDDALVLINNVTGDTADIIGRVGEDPGSNWPVGSGSTVNSTLVRVRTVREGTTDWTLSSGSQWLPFPSNTFDSLGAHTMLPCGVVVNPSVSFATSAFTVNESAGTVTFDVDILNSGADTVAVDVMLNTGSSTAVNGTDFTWTDTTIVFPANASGPITLSVGIIDNAVINPDKDIVFDLMNPTSGATIGANADLTITIQNDDLPLYPIGLVTDDADGDGLGDSLSVNCTLVKRRMELRGVVYGGDLQPVSSALVQFTLIDGTGGISIFTTNGTAVGYPMVTEGDSLHVLGTIDHFNGLTELIADTIIVAGTGSSLAAPLSVNYLDETTESELVQFECFKIIDTTQWATGSGSGFNVDVTNNTDTLQIRIDRDVDDLFNSPAPQGWLHITGIGGQFDSSCPHTEGYQLLPRYAADIVQVPAPSVGFAKDRDTVAENGGSITVFVDQADANPDSTEVTVELDVAGSTAINGTDFTFSTTTLKFAGSCGTTNSGDFDIQILDNASSDGDLTIELIINTIVNGTATQSGMTIVITDDETTGLNDLLPSGAIKLYPNPAREALYLESSYDMEAVSISNLLGQEVARFEQPDRDTKLNVSNLNQGVYLIRVVTKEGVWAQKWVKE